MVEQQTADPGTNPCRESVSSDGWHFRRCGKPAKYLVTQPGCAKEMYRCGVHIRRYKRRNYAFQELSK